ncbi:MAG: recombinase RecA, partial [Thermoguttaceae bacterium]|nr:recombinase RecA [Thermoguttaceae bacterium]
MVKRLSTGIPGLDEKLGGGLLAGTTTAVVGGSGAGKTQFALQFLNAGFAQAVESRRGVILDLTARGDSQNHAEYAKALFNWTVEEQNPDKTFNPA